MLKYITPVMLTDSTGYYSEAVNTLFTISAVAFVVAVIAATVVLSGGSALVLVGGIAVSSGGIAGSIFAVAAVVSATSGTVALGAMLLENERDEASDIAITSSQSNPTYIYRYGSNTNRNLTPRTQDLNGLSYTTIRPISGSYTVTTIEAINATGLLTTVVTGTHVSVIPIDYSTMDSWIASRETANISPHPYTILLQSISSKSP